MTRKRGVPSWKWQVRYHPYSACLRVHVPRPFGGLEAERRAAAQIGGNDFFSRSLFRNDYNMEYRFRTPEQAHAMHVWFDANAPEHDEWEEKVRGWEMSGRGLRMG